MTIGTRIVRAIAAFANLHPVARAALIEWFEDGRLELFHIAEDASERVNLAADQPERLARLHRRLRAWQTEVGAQMSVVNPSWDSGKPDGRR